MPRSLAVVVASILAARLCNAQIVRGVVTERTSGRAVAGVLIALEPVPPAADVVARVLSNDRGEFAVSAREPGQYILTAKRIGVRRFVSSPFAISAGETRRMDIALDPVSINLPTVEVAGFTACRGRTDALRLASLWEEARTALTATQTTVYDRSLQASVFRYTRILEPKSFQVINESRTDTRGPLTQPFVSVSGDSLSRAGYWREVGGDTVVYHAPDANVLLSDAFLRDHCFAMAPAEKRRPRMIGLAFEPVPKRPVPEIHGTMWLDAATFQLNVVDYRYTRLPRSHADKRIGGEVWLAALPSGAWIVRRWHIRMPQFADFAPLTAAANNRVSSPPAMYSSLGVTRRTGQVHRVVEEGGNVFADGVRFYTTPADITGVVADSLGQPLPQARVALGGSPFETTSDDGGRFAFDSLPSGAYTLLVRHRDYDWFGVLATDTSMNLNEGDHVSLVLRAKSTSQLNTRMCEFAPSPPDRSTLRVLFRHKVTGLPLASMPMNLYWLGRPVFREGVKLQFVGEKPGGIQGLTDQDGGFNFCGVPAGIPLFIRPLVPVSLEPGPTVALCALAKGGEVTVRVVRTVVPTVPSSPQAPDTVLKLPRCTAPSSEKDSSSTQTGSVQQGDASMQSLRGLQAATCSKENWGKSARSRACSTVMAHSFPAMSNSIRVFSSRSRDSAISPRCSSMWSVSVSVK